MQGFETERLRMRAMADADAPLFCLLYSDAQTMLHIGTPMSPEMASARCARIVRNSVRGCVPFLFAIEANADAIGLCGVVQLDVERGEAEVGMMLLPRACGRSYAT